MKKTDVKLRRLVLVLAIVAVLAVAMGGHLYYSTLKESALEREHGQASEHLKNMRDHIDSYLAWSLASAKALAGLKELQQSLVSKDAIALAGSNAILDHFRDTIQASVCYLMDSSGNTIASSNRNTPTSFVGKNYGFRPYFQQAIQGFPAIYMALGVTSKKRGIYFSHPVYGRGQEGPLGVAVIKTSVELIEKDFKKPHDGIMLVTDPHGIVFVSNRKEWLYRVLWKVSSEEIFEIAKTQQFGQGPWNWTGVKRVDKDNAVDNLGNEYHLHREEIVNYPGWHLVFLHEHHLVSIRVTESLLGTVGFSVLVLCLLFGLFVFFVYKKASSEIIQREKAEEALRESEGKFKSLFEQSNDAIVIHNLKGRILDANDRAFEMLGYNRANLSTLTIPMIHPNSELEKSKKAFKETIEKGHAIFESQFKKEDGTIIDVEISSRFIDKEGGIVQGIIRDTTKRKEMEAALRLERDRLQDALERVKTLSGLLPICATCKKIRDDKGYWNQIEAYIHKHSGAEFSHSICPECANKLYPDLNIYDHD